MAGPTVVQLAWHRSFRPDDYGLTSHSWLEMLLSDNSMSRLNFFADRGLSETRHEAADWTLGLDSIYDDRVTDDFSETLSADRLRLICEAAARSTPYSTIEFNCHHWCLSVWNHVVAEELQQTSFPDQWKSSILSSLGLASLFDADPEEDTGVDGSVRPNLLAGCWPGSRFASTAACGASGCGPSKYNPASLQSTIRHL